MIFSPVRLEEDTVDLFEVDGTSLVADALKERAQTEAASATQKAFARADDQGECFLGEGGSSSQRRAYPPVSFLEISTHAE